MKITNIEPGALWVYTHLLQEHTSTIILLRILLILLGQAIRQMDNSLVSSQAYDMKPLISRAAFKDSTSNPRLK